MLAASSVANNVDPFGKATAPVVAPKGHAFLYPFNRKLRHLIGISVRNINVTHPNRLRGKTTDDGSLPKSWQSPAKLLAGEEANRLSHSRSSTDLANANAIASGTPKDLQEVEAKSLLRTRPTELKLRRRSTLNWTGASPQARQRRLEDATGSKMVDTFFSLHNLDISEPLYVSEVCQKTMNPSFLLFDLKTCVSQVTRSDEVTVKLWVKTEASKDYVLLVQLDANLESLHFLGNELDHHHNLLPQNCILFHLSDGIYTSFTDMPSARPPIPPSFTRGRSQDGATRLSASFNTLMRLATLEDCVQDALRSREKMAREIDVSLQKQRQSQCVIDDALEASEQLAGLRKALSSQKTKVEQMSASRYNLRATLAVRQRALREGQQTQNDAERYRDLAVQEQEDHHTKIEDCATNIAGQRRRICEDVLYIYPIEPLQNRALSFTIRSLPLSPKSYEDLREAEIAAALGFVAHVVYLVASYLATVVPYPISYRSSTSLIEDPIAIMKGSRTYPLYPHNSIPFRFEYGVFLLNKDIEHLMSIVGLRILDIRHTLPNLKYLLYVLTAGEGELPARKAGGIKGLTSSRANHRQLSSDENGNSFQTPNDQSKVFEADTTLGKTRNNLKRVPRQLGRPKARYIP